MIVQRNIFFKFISVFTLDFDLNTFYCVINMYMYMYIRGSNTSPYNLQDSLHKYNYQKTSLWKKTLLIRYKLKIHVHCYYDKYKSGHYVIHEMDFNIFNLFILLFFQSTFSFILFFFQTTWHTCYLIQLTLIFYHLKNF